MAQLKKCVIYHAPSVWNKRFIGIVDASIDRQIGRQRDEFKTHRDKETEE